MGEEDYFFKSLQILLKEYPHTINIEIKQFPDLNKLVPKSNNM